MGTVCLKLCIVIEVERFKKEQYTLKVTIILFKNHFINNFDEVGIIKIEINYFLNNLII